MDITNIVVKGLVHLENEYSLEFDEIDSWDSFVAAWLPGTEGSGVADVLFGDYNPTGKLSFSWPKNMDQFPINPEDDHLYNFGYGLSY